MDTLPDADVMLDDDGSPAPESLPAPRGRTRARGSLFRLVGAAVVLMVCAGTAFAMRSQTANDQHERAPAETPSAPNGGAPAPAGRALVGPNAEARELKFQKEPKPSSKHKPSTKTRGKSKPTSQRHA